MWSNARVIISRTERHTSSQIQIEINGTKLTPEGMDTVGPAGERSIKRAAKWKKPKQDTTPFSFCSEVSPPHVLARMVF
jgi:hypothetical protein